MSRIQLTKGVAFRFMVYLLLFSALITVLATALELYLDYHKSVDVLRERMAGIKVSYAESLSRAVWDLDEEQIKTQLSGILSLPRIVYVVIKTKHETIEQGTRPEPRFAKAKTFELNFKRPNSTDKGIVLGDLYVEASLEQLYAHMKTRVFVVLMTEGSKIALLATFVFLIFRFMVTRHLHVMAKFAKELNIDNLDTALQVHRIALLESQHDELAQVVNAVNEMRQTIKRQLTERKSSEEELAEQWDLLNNVLSNIPCSIFWKNQDLVYAGCNINFAKDAGFEDPEQVTGTTDHDLPWAKTEADIYEDLDRRVMQTGQPEINVELTQHQSDNKQIIVLCSKVPLQQQSGEIIGILGVHTDITEMKEAEAQIRELNENLEQKVKDRTRQLEESNKELEKTLSRLSQTQDQLVESEKMAALGGLVSGIAHEVNTPVGISVTAATYLKENVDKIELLLNDKKLKKGDFHGFIQSSIDSTGIILQNLERAAELIRGFKQVAVDQSSDQKRRFNVENYCNEILISLRPQLNQTDHTIKLVCPHDIQMFGNPGALSQIITHLITNSLQHAFDGIQQGHMLITISAIDNNLEIIFQDDGKGIPPENLDKIFDPFFTTRRSSSGSSGLGMHILYNTVTQGGGHVQCESEVGKGTTFTIVMPLNEVEEE